VLLVDVDPALVSLHRTDVGSVATFRRYMPPPSSWYKSVR
jgi:hypothetical protein